MTWDPLLVCPVVPSHSPALSADRLLELTAGSLETGQKKVSLGVWKQDKSLPQHQVTFRSPALVHRCLDSHRRHALRSDEVHRRSGERQHHQQEFRREHRGHWHSGMGHGLQQGHPHQELQ